jgi:ABC-type transporter Mla maintaining outer membrane lipid asymmetry ATPase subunit MlaF
VPVVEITGLWTKYGRTVVHQDLNLEIEQGEILSIVGGSGTGKTTLLRQMLGLERPRAAACACSARISARSIPTACKNCATTGACCSSKARCIRR